MALKNRNRYGINWYIVGIKASPLVFLKQVFVILFLTVALPVLPTEVKAGNNMSEDELIPLEKVEVLTVDSREKAEDLAKTLEESGYRSIVETEKLGGKEVYKVFILVRKGEMIPESGGLSQGPAGTKPEQDKEDEGSLRGTSSAGKTGLSTAPSPYQGFIRTMSLTAMNIK